MSALSLERNGEGQTEEGGGENGGREEGEREGGGEERTKKLLSTDIQ